jgi:hypothetical protein
MGNGLPFCGTQPLTTSGLEALLAGAPAFELPPQAHVFSEKRWERVDALLDNVARNASKYKAVDDLVEIMSEVKTLSGEMLRQACESARGQLAQKRLKASQRASNNA